MAAHQTVRMPDGLVTDGLPIALTDARPSGFLGRHFAVRHADLALPERLMDWSDHHVLLALSRRGEDLTGNLLIGSESFTRWQELEFPLITTNDYPTLAAQAMEGNPPGSSAGGERPKFGAFVEGHHVLVKFAVSGAKSTEVSRRWCDLIVLEALALEVIASRGVPTAITRLICTDAYYFLESVRFDRVGLRGRLGVLSLAAVQHDLADPWARAAVRLQKSGQLSAQETRRLQWLDAFGALIANTDRHGHNMVFFNEGEPSLRLAPAFDQAPMLYAPTADGQLIPRAFTLPRATPETLAVWEEARLTAREFWERASNDRRISDQMRRHCSENADCLSHG